MRLMGFGRTAVPGPCGQRAFEGAQGGDRVRVPLESGRHRQQMSDTYRLVEIY